MHRLEQMYNPPTILKYSVSASPYFSAPSRLVTVKKGDTALLHCDVNGDKPINVVWLRGGKTELNPSNNYRVNVKQDVTPDGVSCNQNKKVAKNYVT